MFKWLFHFHFNIFLKFFLLLFVLFFTNFFITLIIFLFIYFLIHFFLHFSFLFDLLFLIFLLFIKFDLRDNLPFNIIRRHILIVLAHQLKRIILFLFILSRTWLLKFVLRLKVFIRSMLNQRHRFAFQPIFFLQINLNWRQSPPEEPQTKISKHKLNEGQIDFFELFRSVSIRNVISQHAITYDRHILYFLQIDTVNILQPLLSSKATPVYFLPHLPVAISQNLSKKNVVIIQFLIHILSHVPKINS